MNNMIMESPGIVRRAPVHVIVRVAGVLALAGIGLSAVLTPLAHAQPVAETERRISGIASVGLVVSDLDRLVAFYTDALGFEKESDSEAAGGSVEHLTGAFGVRRRTARLVLGDERVELTQYLAPEGRAMPADSRSNDRWFQHLAIVVSDLNEAYAHLRVHNVRHASSGPQTLPAWNPSAGGISAFYFKDPDGHVLELIQFPAGKGDPKWQAPTGKLFLGIDHTAIVVADTARSLSLYRDRLGMRVVGTSENYGPEQEHLNGVFGARLRITSLRAEYGPGVELLEYLAPGDGREYPPDARACDLVSWTTNLVAAAPEQLVDQLMQTRTRWISPGLIDNLDDAGWSRAMSLRDPDGHVLVVGEISTAARASGGEAGRAPIDDR